MLVEFSVTNFKSIGNKITFSANASSSSGKRADITIETNNSLAPRVLKSAVILGPNASGKSSLIQSVQFLQGFVANSAKRFTAGDKIPFSRNKFASELSSQPSESEIVFIHEDELFQYGFKLDNEKVYAEWLFARTSKHLSKTKTLFYRELLPNTQDEYEWEINEGQVPGEREQWKKATRSNALFLSTAVQLNSESLRTPFEWIKNSLHIIGANERISHDFTAETLIDKKLEAKIENFIFALDLHIDGFRVVAEKATFPEEAKEFLSEAAFRSLSEDVKNHTEYSVFTTHKTDRGKLVELALHEESDGTQALFGLAGPIFDVLENGYTLLIDELSNSLHPLALKGLVSLFQDPYANKKAAQLIFTSHETSIISKSFMHKDQIWFVERPDGVNTKLTPMSDYDVREVDAFQRSYLGGKYGALPNIRGLSHGS